MALSTLPFYRFLIFITILSLWLTTFLFLVSKKKILCFLCSFFENIFCKSLILFILSSLSSVWGRWVVCLEWGNRLILIFLLWIIGLDSRIDFSSWALNFWWDSAFTIWGISFTITLLDFFFGRILLHWFFICYSTEGVI